MADTSRTIHFHATVEKKTVDCVAVGSDDQIIKTLRKAIEKELNWYQKAGFRRWSNRQFFKALVDHWNESHPPIEYPQNSTEFIRACIQLNMAHEGE